jgi:hypothetical protein
MWQTPIVHTLDTLAPRRTGNACLETFAILLGTVGALTVTATDVQEFGLARSWCLYRSLELGIEGRLVPG